ncbi:hypothetical protein HPB47_002162 [Ixodes persulcatus]|uniref:Uncharacterized protein n=1 Tax=Ixodes persulcatus TaxID=34615 RepID=A0AC60PMD4_IXOPE|nr:hypothetical protein HPB47_002162 [Ixodes persulcatus]
MQRCLLYTGAANRWTRRARALSNKYGVPLPSIDRLEDTSIGLKELREQVRAVENRSLLFETRSGMLGTKRLQVKCGRVEASMMCAICGEEEETMEHLVLRSRRSSRNIVGDLAKKLAAPDKSHEITRHPQTRYCSTVDCQKLAWLFHKAIDTQKNPCDNFYHYVCEGLEDYYRPFPDVTGPYLEAYLKSAAAAMRHLINFVEQPTADPRNIEFETRKVNAYYYHSGEFASFPAAILMPPAFNYGAPPEINYGSLGRIIVHEFMHALDRAWTASLRARSQSFFHTVDMEQAYLSKSQCLLKSATRLPKGARVPQSWMPEFLADHMGQTTNRERSVRILQVLTGATSP